MVRTFKQNWNSGSVVSGIVRRYTNDSEVGVHRLPRPRLPYSNELEAMGPLIWLEMRSINGMRRETWDFDPMPRLVATLPKYEPSRRSRLWISGGSFRIDGDGFRNVPGGTGIRRESIPGLLSRSPVFREKNELYIAKHYGVKPHEAFTGPLELPSDVVAIGFLEAITYRTDRNDGDGISNWRHEFKASREWSFDGDDRPLICTSTSGRGLLLVGGTYTVKFGWIV